MIETQELIWIQTGFFRLLSVPSDELSHQLTDLLELGNGLGAANFEHRHEPLRGRNGWLARIELPPGQYTGGIGQQAGDREPSAVPKRGAGVGVRTPAATGSFAQYGLQARVCAVGCEHRNCNGRGTHRNGAGK